MTDLDHGTDLRERIDLAMSDVSAPAGLTETALEGGRRLRRRRRTLTAMSGAAAAAIVVVVVSGLGGGSPSTGPQIATDPPASPNVDKQTPSPGSEGDSPFPDLPPGWWDAPADRLLDQLEAALPAGVEVVDHELAPSDGAPGEPDVAGGWLSATLSSPTGPGDFEIILYPPDVEPAPDPVTTTDANGDEHTTVFANSPSNRSQTRCGPRSAYVDTCEELLGSDGARIGRLTSTLQDGTITFYEVSLLGPDGGRIYMSAWNANDGKPGPDTEQSAPVPPLTLDQLRALALDPAWTSYSP
jgi:hypothetical protein